MTSSFSTRVPGKWVLAGEHAVLRGAAAIALPHPECGLSLSFDPDTSLERLVVEPFTADTVIGDLLKSIPLEGGGHDGISGVLKIESSIPIGAGFGSSAGLCVALSQWLAPVLKINCEELRDFATRLEHRFHGKSSGMDIAVIAAGEPVSFTMKSGPRALGIKKLPKFTFYDTQLRAKTQRCVAQVEEFIRKDPVAGAEVDEKMSAASRMAMEGLALYDSGQARQGLQVLKTAMRKAGECFYAWGLVPQEAQQIEKRLLEQGALAVKMTGAGGGGMMVALWSDPAGSLA
jgi:mevalonate kinase